MADLLTQRLQQRVQYVVQPAPGGSWHIYPNGQRAFVAHPTAPKAPRPAVAPPQPGQPGSPQPSPLDAQFFADQAGRQFKANNQIAGAQQQSAYDQTDYQTALQRLATQQTQAQDNQRNSYNQRGLYYSGAYGKAQGDLADQYAQQRADMADNLQRKEASRQAAIAAIQQGMPLDDAAAAAEAADRQLARDTTAADSNSLVMNPAVKVKPKPKPKPKKKKH
jgi:hypothetical protein